MKNSSITAKGRIQQIINEAHDEFHIPKLNVDELEEAIKTAASIHKELQDMHNDHIEDEECEHEFDPDEGYMCAHCGYEGMDAIVNAAHEEGEGDR